MSLLSAASRHLGRNGHLSDDRLTEIWSAALDSGTSATDPHLTACAQCRARYAEFTGWLDGLHDVARNEADEAFSPERLAAQQAHVMRRLEGLERPARVIAFPRFSRPVTSTQGHAQRWVAAAAAAGLVIGLAAGQFFDVRNILRPVTQAPVESQDARLTSRPSPGRGVIPAAMSMPAVAASDETLFFGGDARRASERLSSLQAIDEITPRARDFERSR